MAVVAIAGTACSTTTESGNTPKCSTNTDCKAPTSICNVASGACVECLENADCDTGLVCTSFACKAPAGTPCGSDTCTAQQLCFNESHCLDRMKGCESNPEAACGDTGVCIGSESEAYCFTLCNPTANTKSGNNPACWSGWGLCYNASQNDPTVGVCMPPPTNSNELDEPCFDYLHPGTKAYNECKEGLLCAPNDTGDASVCRKACDPTKGADTNPACNGNGCVAMSSSQPKLGYCDSRPNTHKFGEPCGGTDPSQPDYGGCSGDFGCIEVTPGKSLCTSGCIDGWFPCDAGACYTPAGEMFGVCIPQSATRAEGERCLVTADPSAAEWNDCLQGHPCINHVCGPTRTDSRQLNETCEFADATLPDYHGCSTGLTCAISRCLTNCDADAQTGCGTDESCAYYGDVGVCVKNCDPALGVAVNSACSTGNYCMALNEPPPAGFCVPLSAPEFGTGTLGAACGQTGEDWCDSKQGIFCDGKKCVEACDPHGGAQSNTDCDSASAECVESVDYSFKGGICLAAPTKQAGDECNGTTDRCVSQLACVAFDTRLSLCKQNCDPSAETTTCPEHTFCGALDQAGTTGACIDLPQQTRASGQTCLSSPDPRAPEFNDCVSGLGCDYNSSTCKTGLNRYANCTAGTSPCSSDFMCAGVQSVGKYYCLDLCTPSATNAQSNCGADFECLSTGDGRGVCVQKCSAASECTLYGTVCQALGETQQYCL